MKYIYILLTVLIVTGCSRTSQDKDAGQNVESHTGAYLKINQSHYDFGEIDKKETPVINADVEITNQGKIPLVISKIDVACGCMSVDTPKEPILPGQSKTITVTVTTKNQTGTFNKAIFINSNSEDEAVKLFRIMGEIKN